MTGFDSVIIINGRLSHYINGLDIGQCRIRCPRYLINYELGPVPILKHWMDYIRHRLSRNDDALGILVANRWHYQDIYVASP